jgi:hypothetical protein
MSIVTCKSAILMSVDAGYGQDPVLLLQQTFNLPPVDRGLPVAGLDSIEGWKARHYPQGHLHLPGLRLHYASSVTFVAMRLINRLMSNSSRFEKRVTVKNKRQNSDSLPLKIGRYTGRLSKFDGTRHPNFNSKSC